MGFELVVNRRNNLIFSSRCFNFKSTLLITQFGQSFSGVVTCFKTNSLDCTLLAQWEQNYAEPWLLVTDLSPQEAQSYWYAMRSWIECLFKDLKRGGLGWHQTKMSDPSRAERLWLAIAVASIFLISLGSQPSGHQYSDKQQFPNETIKTQNSQSPTAPEEINYASEFPKQNQCLSCFRRGFITLLVHAIKGLSLPINQFHPDFFPAPG